MTKSDRLKSGRTPTWCSGPVVHSASIARPRKFGSTGPCCSIEMIRKSVGARTLNWASWERRTEMRISILIAILILIAPVSAASQTIAIVNGTVCPVSSAPIQNGTVLIRDGVIVAVGAHVAVPAGAIRIDASGKIVTPGLINSQTELGVIEIDQVKETNDVTAKGTNNVSA